MNLFQQAMYRGKPQPQKNTAMTGDDIRNTMCERGLTGVKATALVHSGKWKNHKYLYIDANGKYVYPEDVTRNARDKVSSAAKDLKIKLKDKKFKWDSKHRTYRNLGEANANTQAGKKNNQLTSAHQEGTKKLDSLRYINTHESGNKKVKKVTYNGDWVGQETVDNELEKRKKINQQRKSAHAGYERDKRIFPDGGSTEELERQKQKAKDRKYVKSSKKKSALQQQKEAHAGYERDKRIFPDGGSTEELERQKELTKRRKKKASSYEPDYKSSKSTKVAIGSGEYTKAVNKKKKENERSDRNIQNAIKAAKAGKKGYDLSKSFANDTNTRKKYSTKDEMRKKAEEERIQAAKASDKEKRKRANSKNSNTAKKAKRDRTYKKIKKLAFMSRL